MQWNPDTGLTPGQVVRIEAGDVQGAVVHVGIPGVQGRPGVVGTVHRGGNELVDELQLVVITHVEHDGLTIDRLGGPHAFVGEAAKRRALARRGLRVQRVDFHDVAELIALVAVILRGRFARHERDVETAELVLVLVHVTGQGRPFVEPTGYTNANTGQEVGIANLGRDFL